MKIILTFFWLICCVSVSAQTSLQAGQHWQITEGEETWVIEIEKGLGEGFFSAKLIQGDVPKDHDFYVNGEVDKDRFAFQFMFNPLFVTDSGFGFRCSVALENLSGRQQAVRGELLRYRGSIAGPQWSSEKESCTVHLLKEATAEPQ